MKGRLERISDWEALARAGEFEPAKMAALCPISLRQLERFFAEHFRKTPGEWTRELQCRLAQHLIAEGYSTKAAALELKFTNEPHLCREFKKLFGVTPQTCAPLYGHRPDPLTKGIMSRLW
jgi:AraC-like DNA-binding protein